MFKTVLGTKSNMSSVYNQLGHQVPVTTIMVEPNFVIGVRDKKIILGMGKKKKSKKTENAFIKITGYSPRFIKEVTVKTEEKSKIPQEENPQTSEKDITKINLGDKVTVSIFEAGDEVKVTGQTKGKGFAGGVKRWGFSGGPKTHGQSDRHRAPGSIGMGTTPGRVFKGKKMAGHMGNAKITITGLEVVEVNESKNLLKVKGAIPGHKDGFLIIEKTGKVKGYTTPPPRSEEKQAEKEAKEKSEDTNNSKEISEKEIIVEPKSSESKAPDSPDKSDASVKSEKEAENAKN